MQTNKSRLRNVGDTTAMIRKLLTLLALSLPVFAQNGDKPGEAQHEVVAANLIPPAPVLSPADQIRTFQLPPGFVAELVAAEPLVHSPVAIQFDHRGRIWVVEMRGYMPDQEARGEGDPTGSIAILEDNDGDGRMDRRIVFADGLVMPRALMLTMGGALVAEPPRLWFMRDNDGDGRADEKLLVASDYATQNDPALGAKSNPEHASNGLLRALDNWVYSANHTVRFRHAGGSPTNWVRENTVFRGQWGLSQDDVGRLFHNSNSDQIRADLLPDWYLSRNPNLKQPFGLNSQLASSQRVWPGRVNPGVNRGYQPNTLTPEGKLAQFTGACGPVVYRGDQFPDDFRGNVFLCEPTANVIRRNKITEDDGVLKAENAYTEAEFLTSTDERFRPVNLQNGPDGCLYVVDMARGLIQHRIYLTSYLRKQIESRDLQAPTDLGRIYRIVHTGRIPARKDSMPEQPSTQDLVSRLGSPNGFWRDTAQRILVERQDADAVSILRQQVRTPDITPALARLHALWTLEGQGTLDAATFSAALEDPDTRVRTAAIRVFDSFPKGPERDAALEQLFRRAGFVRPDSQVQFLLTLGGVATPQADNLMRIILMNGPASALRFDAAISGLKGREFAFLQGMLADPLCGPSKKDHAPFISKLVRCIATAGDPEEIAGVFKLISKRPGPDWQVLATLDGFAAMLPPPSAAKPAPKPKQIAVKSEPLGFKALRESPHTEVTDRMVRLEPLFTWPGKASMAGDVAATPVRELNDDAKASLERGREIYPTICGACHQPHGNGQEGLAPPLVESEWVLGPDQRLIRIVLHGVRDAIVVKGVKYELNMPALAEALDDTQIADVLTYIRREWGHTGDPIGSAAVKAIREQESKREDSWTQDELLKIR
jgi:mono/diheme cytochrome c family protein/glucose/arabinose dehydrogenase